MKKQIDEGILYHCKKPKPWRSEIWGQFHEIRVKETEQKIDFYFFCIECDQIVLNVAKDGNTNKFRRHICYNKENDSLQNNTASKSLVIKQSDKDRFKEAAVNLVCKDLRPYSAIECEGLIDLCHASMIFGQQYPKAKKGDLIASLPTRNTVKSAVGKAAKLNKKKSQNYCWQLAIMEA